MNQLRFVVFMMILLYWGRLLLEHNPSTVHTVLNTNSLSWLSRRRRRHKLRLPRILSLCQCKMRQLPRWPLSCKRMTHQVLALARAVSIRSTLLLLQWKQFNAL
jgi:hypothetical protein